MWVSNNPIMFDTLMCSISFDPFKCWCDCGMYQFLKKDTSGQWPLEYDCEMGVLFLWNSLSNQCEISTGLWFLLGLVRLIMYEFIGLRVYSDWWHLCVTKFWQCTHVLVAWGWVAKALQRLIQIVGWVCWYSPLDLTVFDFQNLVVQYTFFSCDQYLNCQWW